MRNLCSTFCICIICSAVKLPVKYNRDFPRNSLPHRITFSKVILDIVYKIFIIQLSYVQFRVVAWEVYVKAFFVHLTINPGTNLFAHLGLYKYNMCFPLQLLWLLPCNQNPINKPCWEATRLECSCLYLKEIL